MAILRANELREMSIDELKEKLIELKRELFKERVAVATSGSPSNPGRMRELRRTIARILTIMNEKKRMASQQQ